MNDGGRHSIQSPFISNLPPARPTLSPPFAVLVTVQIVPEVTVHVPYADLKPVEPTLITVDFVPEELPDLAVGLDQFLVSLQPCQRSER